MNNGIRVKYVHKKLADGNSKLYAYDRITGRRILGDPNSPAFLESLDRIRSGQLPPETAGARPADVTAELARLAKLSFIYFIQAASGPVKVGITDNFSRRLRQIQDNIWEDVAVLAVFYGDRALESRLHRIFHRHKLRGEWYDPHPNIFREIECLTRDAKIRPSRGGRKLKRETGNHDRQPTENAA